MDSEGNDCPLCQNFYKNCNCREALEILKELYGWNTESAVLRQCDIRRIAAILEEALK